MAMLCANAREKSKAREGRSEKNQLDSSDKWRQRRIGDIAPVEMLRIGERSEFITMKAVSCVDQHMEEELQRGKRNEEQQIPI